MRLPTSVILALKDGSEEAFNEVYYKYNKLIYYILFTMVNNRTVAEDLLQESFINMFNKIHQLNDPSTFHYWFIQLSKNLAKNYLRKEMRKPDLVEIDFDSLADKKIDQHIPVFEFNGFLNQFENYVITLYFVHNLNFRQISEETGQTMSVVTKAFYQAKKKLKKYYEG